MVPFTNFVLLGDVREWVPSPPLGSVPQPPLPPTSTPHPPLLASDQSPMSACRSTFLILECKVSAHPRLMSVGVHDR